MSTTNWIGGSGDWSVSSDWSAGVPNSATVVANLAGTAAYTVTISGGESFTVGTLNITDPNAALSLSGTLTVTSALNISAGGLTLGGTIIGGTLKQTGGAITYSDGLLQGVKFEGTLDLSASGAHVRVTKGLTLTTTTGTGAGTANVTGAGSEIDFYGTQTINGATINIGNSSYSYLYAYDGGVAGSTVTLGSTLNLVSAGTNVYLTGDSDATILNQGTITAGTGGGLFQIVTVGFTNAGTVNISNNESFTINASAFSNTGTINVTTGATLHLAGSLLGTALGTIKTATLGTVAVDGTLDDTGFALNVGGANPLGKVTLDGTILSGTIIDAGSGFTFTNGALDGVKYQGTMDLSAASAHVRIYDGITLTAVSGTGNGAVKVTGSSSEIDFYGTQTVNNATITLGNGSNYDFLYAYATGPTTTLTLGAGLTITSGGANVYLTGGSNAKIVNQGKINAGTGGGSFTINPVAFTNIGTISVTNGESLTINAGTFANAGTISVTTSATLHLAGNLMSASLGTIKVTTGGTVAIDGTLDNTSHILKVGGTNLLGKVTLDGTIFSGTIVDAGSGFTFANSALDGVKYEGTMDLSAASAHVRIYDGITLTGVTGTGNGAVNVTGSSSEIDFYGTQTVDKATITLGSGSNYDFLYAYATGPTATLTLGAGLTITSGGANVYLTGGSNAKIVNKGIINAGTGGGSFTINPVAFTNSGTINVTNTESLTINTGTFSNTGTINVTTTAVLHLAGNLVGTALGTIKATTGGTVAIDGTLDDTGFTLNVGGTNPLGKVTLDGTVASGTIIDAGSGFTFANGALDGVKYEGTMDLSATSAHVRIYDGITLTGVTGTGNGAVNVTGSSSDIDFYGTQTVDNATITLGSGSNYDFLYAYAAGPTATLTLGAGLTITSGGANVYLTGGSNAKIVNNGTINAGTGGGSFTINPSAFANAGTITVSNGESLHIGTIFSNTATAEVVNGLLDLQSTVGGSGGTLKIDATGKLEAEHGVGSGQSVLFSGTGGTLQIDSANVFAASIHGFIKGDFIDLRNIAFGPSTTMSFSGTATQGTLTVSDGVHTANLLLIGNFVAASFAKAADSAGGTAITYTGAGGGAVPSSSLPTSLATAAPTMFAKPAASPAADIAGETLHSQLDRLIAAVAAHSTEAAGLAAADSQHGLYGAAQHVLAAPWHQA